MARIYSNGFETQSLAASRELLGVTGSPTVNTSIKNGGLASMEISGTIATVSSEDVSWDFAAKTALYVRYYMYIDSQDSDPDVNTFLDCYSGGTNVTSVQFVNSGGTLSGIAYYNDFASSAALSGTYALDTWYRVEMYYDSTPANGSEILQVRINGVNVLNLNNLTYTIKNLTSVDFGVYNGSAGSISGTKSHFDDIAINDTSGTAQNSWPGEGKLVLARPTAAGDNAATAGLFSSVNEVPVSDTVTSSANRIELDTNTTIADYQMTDSWALGIHPKDSVSLIEGIILIREDTSLATGYNMRLKSASGGSLATSATADAGNTTLRINPTGTTAYTNRLVSYTDPTTGVAWTPTGTNSIDNMQFGVASTTGNDIWVAWMGAYIEYVESPTAIRLDAVSSGQNDGASSITVSHTTGTQSNRILIVKTHAEANATPANRPVTGITYDGVALTQIDAELFTSPGGEDDSLELWYLVAPNTGTHDVVVTFTGAVEGCVVAAETYYNVTQTSPIDTFGTTSATSVGPVEGGALTTTQDYELIVDAAQAMSSGNILAVNSGQTSNYNISNTGQLVAAGGYKVVGVAGNYTPSWTVNASTDWLYGAAAIKPMGDLSINVSENVTITESVQGIVTTDVIYTIADSQDDGVETNDNTWTNNATHNGFGFFTGVYNNLHYGLRFPGVAIPQGATIVAAHVEAYTESTASAGTPTDVHGRIRANDVDNAPVWTSLIRVSNMTPTTAFVDWDPVSFTTSRLSSPDITSVIQEIVDRSGWSSGNAIGIGVLNDGTTGSNVIGFQDYGTTPSNAPTLHITFSAPSGGVSDLSINKSESITVTESVNRMLESNRAVSDSVTVSENVQVTLVSNVNVSDSITLTESVKSELNSNIRVSDSITVTEAISILLPFLVIAKTESITITENIVRVLESFINVSDSVTVTENVKAELNSHIRVSDSITITESVNRLLESNINKSESVTVTEAVSVLIPTLIVNVSDSITLTENSVVNFADASALASDSIAVSENVKVELNSDIRVAENIGVTDTPNVALAHQINVSDSITLTESVNNTLTHNIATSDSITVKDNFGYALSFDGSQNYVAMGTMGNFGSSIGSGFYTKFSIQTTSTAVGAWFVDNNSFGKNTVQLAFNIGPGGASSGRLRFTIKDNSATVKILAGGVNTPTVNFNDGNVHVIELQALPASNSIAISIDGIAQTVVYSAQATPNTFINWPNPLFVGAQDASGTPNSFFQAVVDNLLLGTTSANILGNYSFNEGYGLATADASGQGNNGTLTGSPVPTWVDGLVPTSTNVALSAPQISVSENIAVTEGVDPELNSFINKSESITVTENTSISLPQAERSVAVSDSITVSENTVLDIPIEINVSEIITVTESIKTELISDVRVAENIAVSESTSTVVSDPQVQVSDSITVSESVKFELNSTINVSDSVAVTENVIAFIPVLHVNVSDSITVTENSEVSGDKYITVSDSITVTDTANVAKALQIAVSDSVTLTESLVATPPYFPPPPPTLIFVDGRLAYLIVEANIPHYIFV